MNNFWHRAKPFVWGTLCILLALYLSQLNVVVGYAMSTHDVAPIWAVLFDPRASIMQFLLAMLLTFGACCIIIVGGTTAIQNRQRPTFHFYCAAFFCVIIVAPLFYMRSYKPYLWSIRRAGLEAAAVRAKPLVAAIERYKTDKGRPPENLQLLVPRYIARVPQTGMVSYPDFRYSCDNWGAGAGQFYKLRVLTGFALSYESFNYFSDRKYPARLYSGRVERMGDWAYVHTSVLSEK